MILDPYTRRTAEPAGGQTCLKFRVRSFSSVSQKVSQSILAVLVAVSFGLPATSFGQSWSGVLSSSRAIDWSQAGIPGGIPNRSTTCATLSPGASAAQINTAIQNCPAGQVVFLNAGTYNLSAGILLSKSNVTVRGAGASQTILNFSAAANCGVGMGDASVCITNGDFSFYPANANRISTNWTGGYAKGSTSITLSNTTGLQVGKLIVLNQQDPSSDPGTVWICGPGCAYEGVADSFSEGNNRQQQQVVMVTSVSGSTVGISPGVYMSNYSASLSPHAFWGNGGLPVTNSGIENVTLNNRGVGVTMFGAYRCWASGVKSVNMNGARAHVWLFSSKSNVIRDSYFYGSGGQSQSYAIETDVTSDSLIENNIWESVAGAHTQGTGTAGNVFGYNFAVHDGYSNPASWMQPESNMHAGGTHMLLFEGNQGQGFQGDDIHGPSVFITSFRERNIGWDTGKTGNTVPVQICRLNRYWSVIGGVLGQAGYHTSYGSIFNVGHTYPGGNLADDPLTVSSLMRWGNYDVANSAARFVASEVPSALSVYANSVPASQSLPASFYLGAKPGFWGNSIPWPAIGPDVNGANGPGGHSYDIPAAVCYKNTPASGGILNFDASRCYAQSSGPVAPAPPTNLTSTVL